MMSASTTTAPLNTASTKGRTEAPIFVESGTRERSGAAAREARRQFRMAAGIVVVSLVAGIAMAGTQLARSGGFTPAASGYGIDTTPVMISAKATDEARYAQMR